MRFSGYCILCLSWLFAGCTKFWKRDCRKDLPTNTGIILREFHDCIPKQSNVKTTSITRQTQWDSLWNDPNYPPPSGCVKPNMDFSNESILFFRSSGGQGYKIFRDVSMDEKAKQYVYTLKEVNCSNRLRHRKVLMVSDNTVVVPRLPDGWTIRFRNLEE